MRVIFKKKDRERRERERGEGEEREREERKERIHSGENTYMLREVELIH